jgi:FkbM family methyltransferase
MASDGAWQAHGRKACLKLAGLLVLSAIGTQSSSLSSSAAGQRGADAVGAAGEGAGGCTTAGELAPSIAFFAAHDCGANFSRDVQGPSFSPFEVSVGEVEDLAPFLHSSYQLFGCSVPGIGLDGDGHLVLPDTIKRLKIDVGLSFNAPNSQLWLQKIPELAVFGFEPNLQAVADLLSGRNRARGPRYVYLDQAFMGSKWFLFPVALGSKRGHVRLHATEADPGMSSVFEPDGTYAPMKSRSVYPVPILLLSDLLSRIPWGYEGDPGVFPVVEHIKTDAQGFDVEVLRGAGKYLSERVVCVTAEKEAGGYKGGHSAQDLLDFMWNQGFGLLEDTGDSFTFFNTNLTDWFPGISRALSVSARTPTL